MIKISTFLIFLIFLDAVLCKNLASFSTTIATISSDNENELVDAIAILNKSGGIIYIDTPIIHISSAISITLSGSIEGSIIGKQQQNGYPVIDFLNCANNDDRGFKITGSKKSIKYLIIQNANKGISITGSYNTLKNIITRYNSDSGILISDNAFYNHFDYCYSYRNGNNMDGSCEYCDGFTQKNGSYENVFFYCSAWDNYGNGWSFYDKEEDKNSHFVILNSTSWNNGNPDVFSGKYDYDNKWPLDKNLTTIKNIIDSDPNYESNYNNRKFAISPLGTYTKYFYDTWLPKAELKGGNGFKFGSKIRQSINYVKRIFMNCLAFDHKSIGFVSDDSQTRYAAVANCVSFNNNINYQFTNRCLQWTNIWSWNPITSDQFKQSNSIRTPKDKDLATSRIYDYRDQIIYNSRYNRFYDNARLDHVINSLNYS